ncbi:DUF7133 domain-containing protein [Tundrisphaera sp. TA3]|uniref:DUF7133 domain-containing protein n=1 Tax=Tundrisphaera sp. TA3 TaxID=3435775 RepID=UPI003EBB38B1
MRRRIVLIVLLTGLAPVRWPAPAAALEAAKPIRALLVAGGCCHDYQKQKTLMTQGVSARANVEWTIIHQGGSTTDAKIPLYENPDWSQGFDVIVHDECFSGVTDPAWVQGILKPHKAGLPAVVLHCAMHSYRDKTDEWFRFLGVTSHGHGANYPFRVENLAKADPIMEGFGDSWMTPKGELYLISKLWDTATPLAHARSRDTKKDEVCIWTNAYGPQKTRIFGTTLGHHNEEVSDPIFLNLLTRGLLWSAGKLDAAYLRPAAAQSAAPAPKKAEDLARGKTATASSSQDDAKKPEFAVDGDDDSRWCADGGSPDQWLQVDLGKPETLTGCRVLWEFEGPYRYKVEGSADGKAWAILSDQTKASATDADRTHKFDARGIRHVRLSVTSLGEGQWASLYSFEVLGTKLIEPGSAKAAAAPGKKVLAGVKVPAGFTATAFAAPPEISYPTCLAAAPTGEVYVAIDENGSLDAKGNRGRVVRCVDKDGDGQADTFTTFAEMDSPRGIVVDDRTVYVLHPPMLTAFHDDNGDGKADRSDVLVKGIGFDLKFRGADHTTNGIRQGIDGWIYVAVGDYGFIKAEGKDGRTLPFLGGGIVRVRPDGSGLEVVSRGQRNIYDVAIDPRMNLFTRDNTNDGGGWDVRLSHVIPTGNYGYPSLFTRFNDEIVQPLADYGGGSPCGSLYLQEPGFPQGFGDTLYTCEWGRGGIFRHPLTPSGAGFKAGQEMFVEMPRPTDMDVDGQSRIYVSSWRDGGFTYSKPDVGYVIRITADGDAQPAFPDLKKATPGQLVQHIGSPKSAVLRQAAQRELLRRGVDPASARKLEALATIDLPLAGKVAAIFTLKQGLGAKADDALVRIAGKPDVREFALKALADRVEDAATTPIEPFVAGLEDKDPRVRLQAVIGLGRLGRLEPAAKLVGLTADADPLIAHAAIKSLAALRAVDACVAALLGPDAAKLAYGATHALQAIHESGSVAGLARVMETSRDDAVKLAAFKALCRLHATESPYEGKWWSTRPDTSGPYYNPTSWEGTEAADRALRAALKQADEATARRYLAELLRHKIDFEDATPMALRLADKDATLRAASIDLMASRPALAADAVKFLGSIAAADADPALRVRALRALMRHNKEAEARDAAQDILASIGASKNPATDLLGLWRESLQGAGNNRDLAAIVERANGDDAGQSILAFGRLLHIANNPKAAPARVAEAQKALDLAWKDPASAARLLRAIGLARSKDQAVKVTSLLFDMRPEIRTAAEFAARALDLPTTGAKASSVDPSKTLAKLPFEGVIPAVLADPGDAALGARLFQSQSCINCHTVAKSDPVKGPYLGDITNRYSRTELAESILRPSARISQGFETQKIATVAGQVIEGFVSRESGDELELRNATGALVLIPKSEIDERGKSEQSIMPNGLLDPLTPHDLASLLAYLESLKNK